MNTLPVPSPFDFHQQISEVVLVGTGGTGSQVARTLCRVVYDLRRRGHHTPALKFVDPDVIAMKNVGRQMFTESDINKSKATTLAARFNLAMGLGIVAYVEPFDADKHASRYGSLVVGCVDNHVASQSYCTKPRMRKPLFSEFLRRYSHNCCTNPAKVSEFLRERSIHERISYPHL